jgi:undecaprenyl-diphosphatase
MSDSDQFIINLLHHISANSPWLNNFMYFISDNDFLASGIVVSVFWFFWFHNDQQDILVQKRKKIINALIGCLIAIVIGRLLTHILPFTVRPVLNPDLANLFPFQRAADDLNLNNSMPSDHAILYFALATGIFLISKKVGIITFIYIFLIGNFPRIYLGYHYPIDIFVGAMVGILITLLYSKIWISDVINERVLKFSTNYTGLFYVLFFLLTYQIGTMFDSLRDIQHYLLTAARQFF